MRRLTTIETRMVTDTLALVLNDPDWQEMLGATDAEWNALATAREKMAE